MSQRNRSTETDYQKRLDLTAGLLARGIPSSQVATMICEHWGVSLRQAMRYISIVKDQEGKQLNQTLEIRYSHLSIQLNYVYQQAIQMNDFELARRVISDLIELYKLQRNELLNDPDYSPASGLIDANELEALICLIEEKKGR